MATRRWSHSHVDDGSVYGISFVYWHACDIHLYVDGGWSYGLYISIYMGMAVVTMAYIGPLGYGTHLHVDGSCDNGVICPLACGIHSHMWMAVVIMV